MIDGNISDRLTEVIEDLQGDEELSRLNEAAVSANVRRVFNALGWDGDNYREVRPEYSVGGLQVDYALFLGDTAQVFVEVKRGGDRLEQHQDQLLQYAYREDIRLALLTNGTEWWLYLPRQSGNWEQRRFATISLDEWEKAEIVSVLAGVLGKENVNDGSAFQNAEHLYKQMQRQTEVSETLPEAWNQLIDEFDELIVARLAEKTGELCEHEPDENEVKAFLSKHLQDIQIPTPPVIPPPKKPGKRGVRKPSTRLSATINGTTIEETDAASTFVEVIRRIGIQRVKDLEIKVNGTDLISTSEDAQQRRELNGHWINVQTSTQTKSDRLKEIASSLDDVSLKVEIIPK